MPKSKKTNDADDGLIVPKDESSTAFVRNLIARGQAAKPDSKGMLPPGATHEIVGETEIGVPILKRRRFSLR